MTTLPITPSAVRTLTSPVQQSAVPSQGPQPAANDPTPPAKTPMFVIVDENGNTIPTPPGITIGFYEDLPNYETEILPKMKQFEAERRLEEEGAEIVKDIGQSPAVQGPLFPENAYGDPTPEPKQVVPVSLFQQPTSFQPALQPRTVDIHGPTGLSVEQLAVLYQFGQQPLPEGSIWQIRGPSGESLIVQVGQQQPAPDHQPSSVLIESYNEPTRTTALPPQDLPDDSDRPVPFVTKPASSSSEKAEQVRGLIPCAPPISQAISTLDVEERKAVVRKELGLSPAYCKFAVLSNTKLGEEHALNSAWRAVERFLNKNKGLKDLPVSQYKKALEPIQFYAYWAGVLDDAEKYQIARELLEEVRTRIGR
jgi:hypothetical protein